MVNRRIGRPNRLKQKKKEKRAKKECISHTKNDEGSSFSPATLTVKKKVSKNGKLKVKKTSAQVALGSVVYKLKKKKAELLKQQAAERMVLKERLRELTDKKNRMRKGENVKAERRELGKYIRDLREQLLKKHADDLAAIQKELEAATARPREAKRTRCLIAPGVPATLYRHQEDAFQDNDVDWTDEDEADDDDIEGHREPLGDDEIRKMFSHLVV